MVTTPTKNDLNWDVSLNAALNSLQAGIDGNVASIATNTANIATLTNSLGFAKPSDHGAIAWTHDPATINGGQLTTNGTVCLSSLWVTQSVIATKFFWGITTAGASPTSSQNFIGLYNASGTRLANVNVDARITLANNMFQETINVSLVPGMYWAAFVFNAGTAPTVFRGPNINGSAINFNLATTALRYATNVTGQTSLPSPLVPASNAISQNSFWAAVA